MSYRDFQRAHPEWPRRIRDADGQRVRLRCGIETRGGVRFAAGEVLKIGSTYRGMLDLEDLENGTLRIRRVSCGEVELLEEAPDG